MRGLTFILIVYVMAGLSYDIYRHARVTRPYEQQQSQSPIGHGMVWWYPADISYTQSGKPYPLVGHIMVVVSPAGFEMD